MCFLEKEEDNDEDVKMDCIATNKLLDDGNSTTQAANDTSVSTGPSIDTMADKNNEATAANAGGEDESRAEATFQLVVEDFTKFKEMKESRLSPQPCVVRNLPWKILAMSKQTNNRDFSLGFFLQCNAESESTRWSVCAVAELRLVHQTDPEKNFTKKIQHLFYLKENDWGFSPFISMKEILDPEKGLS